MTILSKILAIECFSSYYCHYYIDTLMLYRILIQEETRGKQYEHMNIKTPQPDALHHHHHIIFFFLPLVLGMCLGVSLIPHLSSVVVEARVRMASDTVRFQNHEYRHPFTYAYMVCFV